jgi:L-arabinose 1-dehydrogenase [NAD(P)+]
MWLSPRDCRDAFEAAALSELPENPLTVHVISASDERCLSLTHTLRSIGYTPRDNASEVLDGQ